MKGIALLLIALVGAVLSQADVYYWSFENEDAPFEDLLYVPNATIAQLMAKCTSLPQCLGFNAHGFLKNSTLNMQPAPVTFYLKSSVPPPSTDPFLVPMPQTVSLGNTAVAVLPSLAIKTPSTNTDLQNAIARYTNQIFVHPPSSRAKPYKVTLPGITITVQNLTVPLQLGVDESYTIVIPADGTAGTITANTVYGAYHALETLSQLITYNFLTHSYEVSVAPVSITDFPRFPHRGLLIDSSRHFQPIESILHVIDSMTYAKLNTLHWHIVDSQSFPFESINYPYLWNGSYTEEERFTQEDVASVVEYARQRGVRVMVEFDMPGHAASWCVGYPEICPNATCNQPLNPATNATFDLITGLLSEVTGKQPGAGLFPENLLHLGGDEVDTACWSTPEIDTWLRNNNMNVSQAYMYFVLRAHQIAIAQGRIPVNWEEVFNNFGTQLDPRSIIHIWLDHATLARVVAAGYRAILSNSDVWYLDHLSVPWESFYLNDPFENISDPKQQALVLGGEVCMWGETVDPSDIMQTIWPRAAAAAERLWSAATMNQTAEFLPRLSAFRCLLNQRGVAAAPTNELPARSAPGGPGSCYVQ